MESLVSVVEAVKGIPLIASGGVRSGIDMAKAVALGASYAGMALPLLAPAMHSAEAVKERIQRVITEFRVAMLCSGKKDVEELRTGHGIEEIRR